MSKMIEQLGALRVRLVLTTPSLLVLKLVYISLLHVFAAQRSQPTCIAKWY